MGSFDQFLNESKIQIKRKYTENHPAKTVGKAAKIRNKMLEAAADGKITKEEFDAILREMSTDTGRWMRRNSRYFNVSEESVSLSKTGQRILNELQKELVVNEKASVFTMANAKAEEIFGEFGIATLDFDELGQIIDIKKADKIAKRKYGEEGFMSLTEIEMEELLEKNPKLLKENKTNKNMENKFLFESFEEFEASLDSLNEAFKSTKFSQLFMQTSRYSGKKSFNKDLVKAFYQATKIDLSRIEDEDILTSDPQTVYKNKTDDTIVFYISDNAKENPYAPYDSYGENKNIPGGGYLLAMTTGKNEFYGVEWSRYGSRGRTLAKRDNNSGDTVGISKKYKGWDGTGLYNVKRIAEVADRAVVLNIALLKQKYSTEELRASREEARRGATAFKNAKDFKSENNARYAKILADKASKLPLDKMVKDAIDTLGAQIQAGLSKGEKTEYGEIKIGENPRGRAVKLTDAASHMSSILSDYERYVSYIKQAEDSEARYGERESYYERESKDYAKRVKDKIDKIEVFNYAW